jgi:hypothetical protein
MLLPVHLAREAGPDEKEVLPPLTPIPPNGGKSWKGRLLLALSSCLAALLILQIVAGTIERASSFANTCAGLVRETDYTRAVHFHPNTQQMSAIQMADALDGGEPAALVQVTSPHPSDMLDVYVFGCIISQKHPLLTLLFSQRGLEQGTAEITSYGTLVTASRDPYLPPERVATLQPLQQDVYHEYTWQQGHFVQLPFPGFYPVTSQFEAQTLQQNANIEHHAFWLDPILTAMQMSKDLLNWSGSPRLVSETATTALVELTAQYPSVTLDVTLKRLIQPGQGGLWFVTDARTPGLLLTRAGTVDQPFALTVTSPIHLGGASALIDGHTTATLFDHTLTPVAGATHVPLTVQSNSIYAGSLTYANLAQGQQGILLIRSQPLPQNNDKEPEQILLTRITLN